MDYMGNKNCGCKGRRTCLLCEEEKGCVEENMEKEIVQYTYCSHCNLCWPSETSKEMELIPIYLADLMVITDFLTDDEEASIIAAIDDISWRPSQSGRRKQDFGPKVNFKKKKAKLGDFKGFPLLSKQVIEKFQLFKELADFSPVELCHLDYRPEMGSAIEPHIDDTWIWGERLVTVNLASSTVLTLSPANSGACSCRGFRRKTIYNSGKNTALLNSKDNKSDKYCCNHISLHIDPEETEIWNSDLFRGSLSDACAFQQLVMKDGKKLEVLVVIPPKSLLILSGCCRHNWFHEIKRQYITSRRLAMTFRELSENFREGGQEKHLGDELLTLGQRFYDCHA